MTALNLFATVDEVASGDAFIIYSPSNSDGRRVPRAVLVAYLQDALTFPSTGWAGYDVQYAAPSSSGFSVTITPTTAGNHVHLILTPTAGFAAGTIVLPAIANVVNKQEVLVNCTQQVTALTINGNGAIAVTGEPTALGADDFFRLKYDSLTQTWYRVG